MVSPRCLERGQSSTPSHHQCEGRPPLPNKPWLARLARGAGARYPIYKLGTRDQCMTALRPACLTSACSVSVMPDMNQTVRLSVPLPAFDSPQWQSSLRAFAWGMRSVASTVLTLVLFATYLGIG